MKPVDIDSVLAFESDFKNSEHHELYVYHEHGNSIQCSHACCDILSDNYSFGVFLKSSEKYVRVCKRDVFDENRGWELVDKMNEYSFLPKFLFQTENHLVFEWFHTWEMPTVGDFISPNIQLKHSLNIEVDELEMSPFFHDVLAQLKEFHNSGLTVDQIQRDDFVVKRDDSGKIVDWKYVRATSVTPVIDIPRYLFVLDSDTYPDDDVYDEIQPDGSIVYIHVFDKWYEHCSVENA